MKNNFVNRILKGTVSTTSGTIVSIFMGFLNIMVATRVVSKETIGSYLFVIVIVNFLMILCDMGLNISLTRELSCTQNSKNADTLIISTFVVKLLFIMLISGIIVTFRHLMGNIFNNSLDSDAVVYIAILLIFDSLNVFYKSVLQGLHLFKKMAIAQTIIGITNFLFILLFVLCAHLGVFSLVFSRILALTAGITFQYFARPLRITLKIDIPYIKKLFIFGYTLGINNLFSIIFNRFAMFFIGTLLGPVAIAGYGVASKIPDGFSQIFESYRTVYFPSISELYLQNKSTEFNKTLNYSLKFVNFISLLITLILILFGEVILEVLFSSTYVEYAPVLSLLMVALSLGFVGNILGTTLVASGHSRLPMFINIVDMIVNIIANILLIKSFGIVGAAFAAILSRCATIPLNAFFIDRCSTGLNVWELTKPFLFFIACVLLYYFIFPKIFILKVSIIILFLVVSYFFHFNKNELVKIATLFNNNSYKKLTVKFEKD